MSGDVPAGGAPPICGPPPVADGGGGSSDSEGSDSEERSLLQLQAPARAGRGPHPPRQRCASGGRCALIATVIVGCGGLILWEAGDASHPWKVWQDSERDAVRVEQLVQAGGAELWVSFAFLVAGFVQGVAGFGCGMTSMAIIPARGTVSLVDTVPIVAVFNALVCLAIGETVILLTLSLHH